jgi:Cu(I)/Ag(I) efflux system membrane fusion protein
MTAAQPGSAPASAAVSPEAFRAEGEVESIESDNLTISHGPVPALKWPSMTMAFGKPDAKAFSEIKVGDKVRFEFRKGGPMGYELVWVRPAGAAK